MASVVDTSVKYFQSNVSGAPVLNYQPGSLIGVLDAVLVNGYGLQTATSVVVAGGIATMTFPAAFPALVDQVILVAGATPSSLNGEQKIVSVGDKIVRFATAAADGTATGTITAKIAPAGWAKAFAGTNKAAYRSLDPQAHGGGMYLRVDDTADYSARVVGFERMTDIDTGTGQFPTGGQMGGGGYWTKTESNSANPTGWLIASDGRFVLISILTYAFAGAAHKGCVTRGFGDFVSRRASGDAFAVGINYANTQWNPDNTAGALDVGRTTACTAFARSYTGLGASQVTSVIPFSGNAAAVSGKDGTFGAFPSPITGELMLARSYAHSGGVPRANLPGLYTVPQSAVGDSFSTFDRISGSGDLAGRTMVALNSTENPALNYNFGASFIDVTGPWR